MKTANPCRKNYRPEIDPYFNINLLDSYSNIIKMASQRIKYIGRNREKERSHQGAGENWLRHLDSNQGPSG